VNLSSELPWNVTAEQAVALGSEGPVVPLWNGPSAVSRNGADLGAVDREVGGLSAPRSSLVGRTEEESLGVTPIDCLDCVMAGNSLAALASPPRSAFELRADCTKARV
jgi:hypothetical protein